MKKLCIYHGNCADGFTAAWAMRQAFPETEFHAGVYGNEPPDVTGKDVYIVDFAYNAALTAELGRKAHTITILDHHKTAFEALSNWIRPEHVMRMSEDQFAALAQFESSLPIRALFDMKRSGAGVTWDYFFPNTPRPQLLNHIEDRDLWKFALRGTRAIQAAVFSYPYQFEIWDFLMTRSLDTLEKEGEGIERKHFKDIRELLSVVTRRMKIGGYEVSIANLPYTFTADAGNILGKGEPFAGCYWDTPKGRVFSLRSVPEGIDVEAIAKQYGGGGHKNASGFRLSYADAQKLEIAS